MKWTKQLKSIAMISMLALSLAACNVEVGTVSPQEVIENVVKENKKPFSYYAEYKTTLSDGVSLTMKEWKDETGKARTEFVNNLGYASYSVNDGTTIWTYDYESNEVFKFSLEQYDWESINQSPSEQAKSMLEAIENTHTIEVVGTEIMLNREVIHVIATPNKQESNLFAKQELWIDKETWFVLKSSSTIDDLTTITEYTHLEFNPIFENNVFVFEAPEDAEMVELGDVNEPFVVHDMQEAAKYIEQPFYYVEQQNDISVHDITVFSTDNISGQLTINYIKNNLPYFSLVVMPVNDANKAYTGKDGMNVRGQEAIVVEAGDFRSISWVQDGIGYAVLIDSADVTTEEVIALIDAIN